MLLLVSFELSGGVHASMHSPFKFLNFVLSAPPYTLEFGVVVVAVICDSKE